MEFTRTYSFFEPTFTYNVDWQGTRVGAVARNPDNPRKWWASDKTWAGGGDLAQTFPTRWQAAEALWHLHNGTATPDTYGGYATDPPTVPEHAPADMPEPPTCSECGLIPDTRRATCLTCLRG